MLVETGAAAASGVIGAIRQAAQATGANFEYLVAAAQVESRLNPKAAAPTSSARGLYQFIEQTWLNTVKDAGPRLGYGRYAGAITQTSSGRFTVADPALRAEILNLRSDAKANAAMAGAFTQANAQRLTARLGRPPTEGELYIAHFLGAGGAERLIGRAAHEPQVKATELFPGAARANRSIFFDTQGRPKTVSEVYGALVGRYNVARAKSADPVATAFAVPPPVNAAPLSLDPKTVGTRVAAAPLAPESATANAHVARQFAAVPPPPRPDGVPLFHSMFQPEDRTGPVSRVVEDLWSNRPHVAAALTGQSAPVSNKAAKSDRAPFDFFRTSTGNVRSLFAGGS